MEQKAKFIVIGLIGVLAVCLVLLVATFNQKQQLTRERDDLTKENATLSTEIKNLENSLNDSRKKLAVVQQDLDDVSQQKLDIERRLDVAIKEKSDLVEKVKALQGKQQAPVAQQPPSGSQSDAYWATILKQKTDLELQLSNLASQFKSAQIANEQLCREKTSLELEISNLKREKEDVKREFEYNKKLLDSISQELVRERSDKLQIQDSFKLIKSENTILSRQLDALNTRKVDLEKRLQCVQGDKEAVEKKFSDMQTMLTEKISQMNGLREELDAIRQGTADLPEYSPSCKKDAEALTCNKGAVELPPIVVRPQQTEECGVKGTSAPSEGKVLAVNKDSNFVIVDMGEDSGVKSGDTFQVYHKDNSVAAVEVIQVRKSISACDIKRQTESICIGDTVR